MIWPEFYHLPTHFMLHLHFMDSPKVHHLTAPCHVVLKRHHCQACLELGPFYCHSQLELGHRQYVSPKAMISFIIIIIITSAPEESHVKFIDAGDFIFPILN